MKHSTEELIKLKNQYIEKHNCGAPLTLEETAIAIWDPKSGKKPMTSMGIYKIQMKALEKLKLELRKYHITKIDDVVSTKYREYGKISSDQY